MIKMNIMSNKTMSGKSVEEMNFEEYLQEEVGAGYNLIDMLDNLTKPQILESVENYVSSKNQWRSTKNDPPTKGGRYLVWNGYSGTCESVWFGHCNMLSQNEPEKEMSFWISDSKKMPTRWKTHWKKIEGPKK